jgi:hypothetical protein
MWLKLFVTIDDLLKRVHDGLRPQYLPRDPGGGQPQLSVAEVVTMLVWGAWRGLSEKAKLSYYRCEPPRREFPRLGSYSAAVALAAKHARILWALFARGQEYRLVAA